MNNLVWHDEKNYSWTYCDRFYAIRLLSNPIECSLYRVQCSSFSEIEIHLNWIGNFKTMETAKYVAEVIKDAEYYEN